MIDMGPVLRRPDTLASEAVEAIESLVRSWRSRFGRNPVYVYTDGGATSRYIDVYLCDCLPWESSGIIRCFYSLDEHGKVMFANKEQK